MPIPKYNPIELKKNIHYILFNPPVWFHLFNFIKNMPYWVDIESDIKKDYSILKHKRLGIIYYSTINYRRVTIGEWNIWHKAYNPPFSVCGKTILDVGAGCGETALFYFSKGAKKVICIEQDKKLFPFLEKNKLVNNLNMQIIGEPFNLKHLKLEFDVAKMDIEGDEKELLKLDKIDFPLIVEVHGRKMEKHFLQLGFKTQYRPLMSRNPIMNNFKELN